MADGKTHLTANLLTLGAVSGLVLVAAPKLLPPIFAALVLASAITPDADFDGRSEPEQAIMEIPIFGTLFMQTWYGYAIKARHRGISHNVILGTPTRLLWFSLGLLHWYVFITGALYLLKFPFGFTMPALPTPASVGWQNIGLFCLAWYIQDLVHYVLDL